MVDIHPYSPLLGIWLIYTLTHTVRHMIDIHTYFPLLGIWLIYTLTPHC